MSAHRTQLVGVSLILGAAIGFALGLILADPAVAAMLGAAGAGLGIVVGSILDLAAGREPGSGQRS